MSRIESGVEDGRQRKESGGGKKISQGAPHRCTAWYNYAINIQSCSGVYESVEQTQLSDFVSRWQEEK